MTRFAIALITTAAMAGALILYMGWLGTADIPNRDFDMILLLISAELGILLSLRAKSVEKPE